jgi:hypothetical protein
VTNTGPSTLAAGLGVHPGSAIRGFPPGTVGGITNVANAAALAAKADVTVAYDSAASRAPRAQVAGDLVGRLLVPGVYKSTGPLGLTADESAALACVTGTARTELQAGYARLPASGVTDVAAFAPLVGVARATADSAYLVVADGLRPSGGVRLLVRMSLDHGNWMIAELQDAGTP